MHGAKKWQWKEPKPEDLTFWTSMERIIDTLRDNKPVRLSGDTGILLICSALNPAAIDQLSHLRSFEKRVILMENIPMLERFVPEFHEICYDLIDTATRPLTIVYPKFHKIPPELANNDGEIAIRVVSEPDLVKLIRAVRSPLVALPDDPSFVTVTHIDPSHKYAKEQIIRIGLEGEVRILQM
jgi:L-threonylcarbamoyladenylate synthase